MTSKRCVALGIDVGGTKIATGVVRDTGELVAASTLPAPTTYDPEEFFAGVVNCAHTALSIAGVNASVLSGIGCGCGGPMQWPSGKVSPLHIPSWRNFELRDRLSSHFDLDEVYVHNDAVALAAGEHWKGSAQGAANVLAITVSTGIGGGLILSNKLVHGKSGNSGHVGHIVVDPHGPPCKCGGRGCVEAIASGPSTVAWAQSQGWSPVSSEDLTGAFLAEAARRGDPIASRGVARSGYAVGTALASCANLLDLDMVVVVVVAGGFSQSGPIFWSALHGAFLEYAAMDFARTTKILESKEPRDIGIVGAAAFALVPDRYGWGVVDSSSPA